jgi:prolipoprotein diacylglyceryltransferase
MKADWKFATKQLKKIVFLIYGCWAIGGIIAIILAFTFPKEYDQLIYSVPKETLPRIGYAWVGGSIWGGIVGGLISVIWGLINTYKEWKLKLKK